MKLNNVNHVKSYVKKHCPKYDEKKLLFTAKKGSKFGFVAILNGELYFDEFYGSSELLDLIIPRFNLYLTTGNWDTSVYYQPYTSVMDPDGKYSGVTRNVEKVLRFSSERLFHSRIGDIRNNHPLGQNLGFKEVPPTEDCVIFN